MTFRSICIAVYVFFYLIFTTPERIRLKKLEQTDPQEASRIAQAHVQKVFRHLLKISGVTIEVNGLENIPDEAALFVGNHSSYFDIIVTGAAIPGGVGFVAKDSLGNIPGLSSWMKRIHCLFLDRKDIRKGLQTILEGAEISKRRIFHVYLSRRYKKYNRRTWRIQRRQPENGSKSQSPYCSCCHPRH